MAITHVGLWLGAWVGLSVVLSAWVALMNVPKRGKLPLREWSPSMGEGISRQKAWTQFNELGFLHEHFPKTLPDGRAIDSFTVMCPGCNQAIERGYVHGEARACTLWVDVRYVAVCMRCTQWLAGRTLYTCAGKKIVKIIANPEAKIDPWATEWGYDPLYAPMHTPRTTAVRIPGTKKA